MTLRLALTPAQVAEQSADLEDERALTVEQAARILGCDHSTVRKLLRRRQLAGHRVGLGERRGGVRVDLESVRAYKRRRAIGATAEGDGADPTQARPRRRRTANPAHDEAVAQLRAWGVAV